MKILVKAAVIAGIAASTMAAQDKKAVPAQASDPVCGMTVETKTAQTAQYKGKTYYFCSVEDKNDFLKTPDKFIAKNDKKK